MLDYLVILAMGAAAYLGLAVVVASIRWGLQRIRTRRAKARTRRPPAWWITLLVRTTDAGGLVFPSVQFRGDPVPKRATLGLELFDGEGEKRVTVSRPLPMGAQAVEFALDPFAVPDGAQLDDVLRWRWDVVLKSGRRELKRWHEHLLALEGLNAEAEIESVPL